MITQEKPIAQVAQVWDKATARANVGDTFRIPYTPIFQVVEKEILKSGRVWLKVMPMSSSYIEEWVLEPEPQQAPINKTPVQPAQEALDSTQRCQLYPNWEAMAEFKQGRAHSLGDAAQKLEPMCQGANCPYSRGYLEGYNSSIESQPQQEVVKTSEWAVTYNAQWDWYIVWVGKRAVGRAMNHKEAEQMAQKYTAADKFWQEHRQAVLAAYAG